MSSTDQMDAGMPAASEARDEAVLLEYVVHLMRRRPARAIGVGAAALVAASVGQFLLDSPLFAIVGIAVVLGSASEFVFPISYRVTTRRVCAAYGIARMEIEWERIRRVMSGPGGVKLSPLPVASRLDGFRGVTMWAADDGLPGDREHLLRLVAENAPQAARNG